MIVKSSTVLLLCVVTATAAAQESHPTVAERSTAERASIADWETVVFSLSTPSHDLARTVGAIYEGDQRLRLFPEASGNHIIVRLSPDIKDEVIALIRKLDQPVRTIFTEIQVLHATEDDVALDRASSIADQVATLMRESKITELERIRLSGLENVSQSVQHGRTVRQRVATQRVGSRDLASYQNVSVGTAINLSGRVAENGDIVVELDFQKSEADDESEVGPSNSEFRSSLRLTAGVPSLVTAASGHYGQTWLVVTASVDSPADGSVASTARLDRRPTGSDSFFPRLPASGSRRPTTTTRPDERYLAYARACVKKYDQDNDEKLNADERAKMSAPYDAADSDGDGLVTAEELAVSMQGGRRSR